MKRLWLLGLVGLLALSLLFPACEETEDPAGPDTTDFAFAGTWVRISLTVEGEAQYMPAVELLRPDGTGTGWFLAPESDEVIAQNYTWSLQGGDTLIINPAEGDPVTVLYDVVNDDRVILEYEAEGGTWVNEIIRWKEQRDSRLVGEWEMTAQTRNGITIEPDNVFLQTVANGTGTYTDHEGPSTFNWSTVGDFLIVREPTNLGFAMTYTVTGGNMVLTDTRDDGVYVMTFSPYEPGETIDENLVGTWVREYVTFDSEFREHEGLVTFVLNGTGSSSTMIDEELEVFAFTWSSTDSIVTISEVGGEWEAVANYSFTGNKLELFYEEEYDGTTYDVHDIYWKQTGDLPEAALGLWVQAEPYVEDETVETSVSVQLQALGQAQIAYMGYDWIDAMWEEFSGLDEQLWSMSEDRILLMDPDNPIGQAFQFEITGGTAVLSHPGMGTRTFILADGELPSEAVGSYVPLRFMMDGNLIETMEMELRLHADGTGAVTILEDWDEGIVEVDSLRWLIVGDQVLIFDDPESILCDVIDYTRTGNEMTVSQTMFEQEHGELVTMNIVYIYNTQTVEPSLFGTWTKTGETWDDVEQTEFDPFTLQFNEDGTGTFTEDEGEGTFGWSYSTGYVIATFDYPEGRVGVAHAIQINSNQISLTSYMEEEGLVRVVVESFVQE